MEIIYPNADCHYGDHDYQNNGWCKWCSSFNGAWLSYQRYEKAANEGRACEDHFHKTIFAKQTCKRQYMEEEE